MRKNIFVLSKNIYFVTLYLFIDTCNMTSYKTHYRFGYYITICNSQALTCNVSTRYRSPEGSCNNVRNPKWGMEMTAYRRILPNNYADNFTAWPVATSRNALPLARLVSNKLHPEGGETDNRYTLGLMQFGQFLAHDLSYTAFGKNIGLENVECCTSNGQFGKDATTSRCAPMAVTADDPVYKNTDYKCIPFNFERTTTTYDTGCLTRKKPAEPISVSTAYADLSLVYGADFNVAMTTRSLKGGLMNFEIRNNQMWPQGASDPVATCNIDEHDLFTTPCYGGGDNSRMNQNPHLTIIHVTFLRQHNRLAQLLSQLNGHWEDEKLYQEARRLNIALYQHIIYNEYVPRIIGTEFSQAFPQLFKLNDNEDCVNDYDPKVDASVSLEFASAAMRALHSQISGTLHLFDEERTDMGVIHLSEHMNCPKVLERGNVGDRCDLNYDFLTRGLTYQPPLYVNKKFDAEVKHMLFRGHKTHGVDLRALDIQRQRDHGVGTYVQAREHCGLTVPQDFSDLHGIMLQEDIHNLKAVYEDVKDIDLSVGGLLEISENDSLLGPTFRWLLMDQFHRTRVGDRFFYENCQEAKFTKAQLSVIRQATFACLMCENSKCVSKMQPQAFDRPSESNLLSECSKLCKMDLKPWQEHYKGNPSSSLRIYALLVHSCTIALATFWLTVRVVENQVEVNKLDNWLLKMKRFDCSH